MARLCLSLLALLLVVSISADDLKASSQKYTRLKDASAAKNVYIMKKLNSNSPNGTATASSGLTKLKEHSKGKKLVVMKKTVINTPSGAKAASSNTVRLNQLAKGKDITIIKSTLINRPGGARGAKGGAGAEDVAAIARVLDAVGGSTGAEPAPVTYSHGQSVAGGCVSPNPTPTVIHAQFAKILHSHRVFIPLASRHYYDFLSELTTGKRLEEHDPSQACFRSIWNPKYRRVMGFGERAMLQCVTKGLDDDQCRRIDKNAEDHAGIFHLTSVYTDGHSTFLRIGCVHSRGVWAIISNKMVLPDKTKAEMLKKVEEYGFDVESFREIPYAGCDRTFKDDTHEDVCEDEIETVDNSKRDAVMRILEQGVYTVASSELNIYANTLFIRNTPLTEEEDLDSVCAYDKWTSDYAILSGFKGELQSTLDCDTSNIGKITCTPDDQRSSNKKVYVYNSELRVIWTDSAKYVLTYNCLSNDFKTWTLFSTERTLDRNTSRFLLAKIADYGFDPVKSWTQSYARCQHL